ncbi:hypothetical protein OIU78_019387 [Salix suchowensis]|nr:hypothetical protein OIU78_019387 [Salix suchowensis]
MGPSLSDGSNKERMRWPQELHDRFEEAVIQLGGPDRATPKGILRAMGIPGLIIYHVKSHLQVQKCLKLKIEAQGRFLGRIVEENQNGNPKYTKSSSPVSFPSLCDSESNAKEFETDSEGGKAEIQSEEDFQALKILRTENLVFCLGGINWNLSIQFLTIKTWFFKEIQNFHIHLMMSTSHGTFWPPVHHL